MKKIIVYSSFILIALYWIPTPTKASHIQTFEGETGTLQNNAGGSGYSSNWENDSDCAKYDIVSLSLSGTGAKSVNSSAAGLDQCRRQHATENTDLLQREFWFRSSNGNGSYFAMDRGGTWPNTLYFYINDTGGNFYVYDNTTQQALIAADTNDHHVIVTFKFSTEEFRVNIDGTDYPGATTWYHGYNYTVNDLTLGISEQVLGSNNANFRLDDLQPYSASGGGGSSSNSLTLASTTATTTQGEIGRTIFDGLIIYLLTSLYGTWFFLHFLK